MSDKAMRAAFEAWAKREEFPLERNAGSDIYWEDSTTWAWQSWQAATLTERDRCATLAVDSIGHTRLELLETIRKGDTP